MRTRPRPDGAPPHIALLLVVAVAATLIAALIAAVREQATAAPAKMAGVPASAWYGLVGAPPVPAAVGQRVIVLLKAPSLAERVAAAGGHASEAQERRWTAAIVAGQRQLIADLATSGVRVSPEFQYARVVNGFSAALGAPAVALVERAPGVAGVFPVRTSYPAAAAGEGRPAGDLGIALPGVNGRGVTIALLDTGVDIGHPALVGRVAAGYDVVSGDSYADAQQRPDDVREVEQHGTQLAGIMVGPGGIAPGAKIFPIRVAGWQRDAAGGWAVYGRTDQLIAGFERAVDPNGDGDAHDAARIAVVGVAEPYDAFGDGPDAEAVAGALDLDTLVVAPAGNDGPAGPRYGSIAGPGAGAAALTVGAAASRGQGRMADVSMRVGLNTTFAGSVPLATDAAPSRLSLRLALPRTLAAAAGPSAGGLRLSDFFDAGGLSLVAGRAALVPGGDAPQRVAVAAANAGAQAVVLYGGRLPSGALDLGDRSDVPVVGVPEDAGRALVAAVRAGRVARVSIAAGPPAAVGGNIAPFSSRGLTFDGRLKPDLVAPGVGLNAPEPGETEDSTARYGVINGASAATAVVGGALALLAQARPDLDAAELRGALVGTARPLTGEPPTAEGAGELDVGAAAAAELAADPTTIAFHRTVPAGWRETQRVAVRNISTRPVRVTAAVTVDGAPKGVIVAPYPRAFTLRPGKSGTVLVQGRAGRLDRSQSGTVLFHVDGRTALSVPWAAAPPGVDGGLLADVRLARSRFKPSDTSPSVLSFVAGRLVPAKAGYQVRAVLRLDLELRRVGAAKPLGLLSRQRHLLPGRYAFGLTGRGPAGKRLQPGAYVLNVVAYPTNAGRPTRRAVRFVVQ
jgi:subtilisin family serine protease